MTAADRIETALAAALRATAAPEAPPRLAAALAHAVFPGGARVRPQLALAVSIACGDDRPRLSDAAAAAIELIHCASLAHDDMPCFDNSDLRRGRPSVHAAFSEPLALLTGDALIVLAFETLAVAGADAPDRLAGLVATLARRTGMPGGICAGQGWESEASVDLAAYHRAKTGALFVAATTMGALAAGEKAGALDRARRAHRRGLPGRRRPARRAPERVRARKAGRTGRRPRPAERGRGARRRRRGRQAA